MAKKQSFGDKVVKHNKNLEEKQLFLIIFQKFVKVGKLQIGSVHIMKEVVQITQVAINVMDGKN
jgi:hypothetical protein